MRRERRRPVSEINVVPYIDVMLVLLVIFMITTPLLTQGVKVNLPEAQASAIDRKERDPIVISVDKRGRYYLNISSKPNKPISTLVLGHRIAAEIRIAEQAKQKIPVFVKADKDVPYGKVVTAMALLKQAGAEQVGLMTKQRA